MTTVVQYADAHHLTTGYTSILYNTPSEDVGYWYSNMEAALATLNNAKPQMTELETSNVLMKLRESLTGPTNDEAVVPTGISVFPHNTAWAICGVLGLILAIVGTFILAAIASMM